MTENEKRWAHIDAILSEIEETTKALGLGPTIMTDHPHFRECKATVARMERKLLTQISKEPAA